MASSFGPREGVNSFPVAGAEIRPAGDKQAAHLGVAIVGGEVERGDPFVALDVDARSGVEEQSDGFFMASFGRVVQSALSSALPRVRIGASLNEQGANVPAPLIRGEVKRRLAPFVGGGVAGPGVKQPAREGGLPRKCRPVELAEHLIC